MKNKCCFIIVYFGKFPNYFQLFLNSCRENKEFNWLIFTDDDTKFEYPLNVTKFSMQMSDLKIIISEKFDFSIKINDPHKLCDLKPAYGYIFEEYIKKYDFWGHCDVDLVFGRLSNFITDDLLDKYDKLFCLGHCILYKNNFTNNRVFMKPVNGEYWYKESFSNEKTTIFDETYGGNKNVNTIYSYYNKNILSEDLSMNSLIAPANFTKITYDGKNNNYIKENRVNALYIWDKGKVLRYYVREKKFIIEEFMYMHFQARKMKIVGNINEEEKYKILGDGFYPLEVDEVNKRNFKKIRRKIYSFRYIKIQVKWKVNGIKRKILTLKSKMFYF